MSIYTISDSETRFCSKAMRACGGRWNGVRNLWMFASEADAADAAMELYSATRATVVMREELQSMIDDSTAFTAWNYDGTTPLELDRLSFGEALTMLVAGRQVRRLLGIHPLEDSREREEAADVAEAAESREQAFEARARRGRIRRNSSAA